MSLRRFLSAISVLAISAVFIAGAEPVFAQEGDEDQPNFMSRLLGSVGLLALPGPEIDTSERPPLVVPPMSNYVQPNIVPNTDLTPQGAQQNPWNFSAPRQEHLPPPPAADNRPQLSVALPQPMDGTARQRNPDFPVDPEIRAAQKKKKQKKNYTNTADEDWDRLRADRLTSVGPVARPDRPGTNTFGDAAYNRATPKELNAPSNFFGMFRTKKEEPVKFEGEPDRQTLTQPPAGYLTPSANAPYGVLPKEERFRPKASGHQNMPNAGEDIPR
jgi:hypothetical protein